MRLLICLKFTFLRSRCEFAERERETERDRERDRETERERGGVKRYVCWSDNQVCGMSRDMQVNLISVTMILLWKTRETLNVKKTFFNPHVKL